MSGFKYFHLGEEVTFASPANHPDPTLRIDHALLPLDDLVMFDCDKALLTKKVHAKRIEELTEILKTTEQLRPIRVMPIEYAEKQVSLLVVTGLFAVRALRLAGRTHARCELLALNSTHLGRAIQTIEEMIVREREIQRLYDDDEGLIEGFRARMKELNP